MQDKAQEGRKRYNHVNGDRSGLGLTYLFDTAQLLISFLLHVVEKGFEHLQQIVDVLRFSALVCHVHKELLDVKGSNLFHLIDLEFSFQIPLDSLSMFSLLKTSLCSRSLLIVST